MDANMKRINVGDAGVQYADQEVHHVAMTWQERHNFDLQRLDNWIEAQCVEDQRELMRARRRLAIACEIAGNIDAVYFALAYFQTQIGWHSMHAVAMPVAAKGLKFKPGRPKGSVGPVRAWLRRYMKKHPKATAADAWSAIKAKPLPGHTVCDNLTGKYIEAPGNANTDYRQFANLVTLERPKK